MGKILFVRGTRTRADMSDLSVIRGPFCPRMNLSHGKFLNRPVNLIAIKSTDVSRPASYRCKILPKNWDLLPETERVSTLLMALMGMELKSVLPRIFGRLRESLYYKNCFR